ncbi:hypothetical protein OGATHE_000931 [Ogataea polymorpha]|uniref:Uncharacterized protein n=1 Tax=Ogataea polymorpha TaxID=460523 RepID=A0A9P8PTS7_9ASCO|nr:hypothetical protein OGATHE_000931 [Ogataea polymorpha]
MDLIHITEFSVGLGVAQWHVDHTVVGESGQSVDCCHLVTSTSSSGDENTSSLVVQGTGGPQSTGSINESFQLRWEVTKSSWNTKDNTIVFLQSIDSGSWEVWSLRSVEHFEELRGESLWNLQDVCGGANRLDTLSDFLSECGNVVVKRVNNNCDFGHDEI